MPLRTAIVILVWLAGAACAWGSELRFAPPNHGQAQLAVYKPPETLVEALQFGTPDQVLGFLEQGADPNCLMGDRMPPCLQYSLHKGDLESAGYLLKHGADIYRKDIYGNTVLELARSRRPPALLEFILRHSNAAKWQAMQDPRNPMLHSLVRIGGVASIRVLLAHGWDINQPDSEGDTALMTAIQAGQSAAAGLLVAQKADLYIRNKRGDDALYRAVNGGNSDMLRLLLHAGINIQRRYENDQTALMLAVVRKNGEAVALLLKSGGNVHDVNRDGENVLALAVDSRYYRADILPLLLKHGADANSHTKDGQSMLAKAVMERCHLCVDQLLAGGAKVNDGGKHRRPGTDYFSWPPLFWAVEKRDAHLVERLIKAGADVNRTHAPDKTTAAFHAVRDESGDAAMLRLLIRHGAKVEIKDKDYWTPLIRASAVGGLGNVKALLAAGAKVDQPNWHGWTPLMAATQVGDSDKVALLLKHGAAVNARSRQGWTALSEARRAGHFDVVALLEKAGGTDPVNAQPKTRRDRGKLKVEIKVEKQ
jgi:ankyrin repeat protein